VPLAAKKEEEKKKEMHTSHFYTTAEAKLLPRIIFYLHEFPWR
jgi:hypothetical protein